MDVALRAFSPEMQQKFWVATYGSAKIIGSGNFARSTNYISSGDCITMLADPFSYCAARLFGNSSVKFVPALEPGFDHGIGRATYRNAMDTNAQKFNEFLGAR